MDEALQGGLPDRKYAKELLKRIREQYRKGDSTYRDSDFQLRTLLKPFGLNEAQTNSIVSNTLGTSYNVDTVTTGREGGLLNALGAYVPVAPVDYLSQVAKGVPEQLQNFGPQVEKSLAGIGLSMSEADPDPAYMAQRQPELDRTSDSRILQNTLSLLPGTPNNADAFRESARNIENYISTNFDTLKNKLQSFGGIVQSWAEENIPTFELPGYDPESAQLAQERQERRDNLADPQFRRQQLQQIYDRASKEIEANPLPFASTAFERGAASLGGSVPSYATMALAPFDPIKLPTILLSNAVAGRMVAGEAVEGIAQDDVWLEMSQNMTDAQKQEALSYINPIVNFEAYNTRTATELAAAGADALSMLPIGGLPTRLGLDLMGGGASELIDFDLAGRARRRGLRAYAQKMNLPIKDDPRLQLVNRGDYAKAYPAQAQEAFQTGIVMSGAASTPTTLVDALFTNYRNRQPQGNPNQNPGQIQALTNTVLNKLKTLNKKDPKQVQSYLENPITDEVVRNIQAKSDSGQALTKEETEIAKRHNEIDTPILEAAPEATPTDTATDALAEGVAREGEYYRRLQENAARTTEKTPDDSNSKILQSAGRQPSLPGLEEAPATPQDPRFEPLTFTTDRERSKVEQQALQDREARMKQEEEQKTLNQFYEDISENSLFSTFDQAEETDLGTVQTPRDEYESAVSYEDAVQRQAQQLENIRQLQQDAKTVQKAREAAERRQEALIKADQRIAARDLAAEDKQRIQEKLAADKLANQQRLAEIQDVQRGLDQRVKEAKASQVTAKEELRTQQQDALEGMNEGARLAQQRRLQEQANQQALIDQELRLLDENVAQAASTQITGRQAERARQEELLTSMQEEVDTQVAEGALTPREATIAQEEQARAEEDRILQEIDQMEADERSQAQAEEDLAVEQVADQENRKRFNRLVVNLADMQTQRQTEERVQAIFGDLETSERSTVAGGATINPNTPRGAQILKQRELEVLRDAMVAEFPGTSQVDVVETVEQAREMLPEGTELADDTEGFAFRDAEGNPRIVLVGNNIENKQVIEGQTGNALENAVRDGVRIFFHESLGHDGLRQAFGGNEDALNNFMTRLYEARGDEINDWGSRRYSEGDWSKMNDSVKAEEWLVQNFTEEGIAPSGILDSIRVLFGSEFNDASIRKQMNAVQNALRKGRKPKFTLRTPQGARANVGEDIPVEEMEIEIPGQNEQAASEAEPQEQSQGPTTTPIEPDPALDSLIRSLYEKGISPPSKSMITARKKKFFMERPFLKGVDLNSVDVNLIQGMIKAAQDEIDSIMNPVNLEMINNPATRRARKLTAAQRNKVRGLLADIQTMQEILGSAPVAAPPVAQTNQATPEVAPEAAPIQEPVPDPDLKVGDTIRFEGKEATVVGFEDGQNEEVVPVVEDPETGDIRPVPRSMREDLESTSTDVQPIAEETPQEVADTGPAIRMSAGRQFSEKGPEETQEVIGYYRNSSGRLPKVQTLQNLGIDKKVADDVIDKGAVVIRWDRLKAGEEQFGQELWGGQSFPLLDLMQQNDIAGASANGALGAIVNSAVENKTPYVIVELMDESGVDGNPSTLPAYVNMLEERIADLDPADQEQVMREINTRFSEQVASAIFQTALDKPVNAQRMTLRSPFRLDKPIDEKTLFAGLIKKLKDNSVEKKTLIDAVKKVRESDFAKTLKGTSTAKADQLFDALTNDYSLGGVLSPAESTAMQYLIDTRIADMERAAEVGRRAQSNLQPLVDVLPKENSTVEEMTSSLNDAVTLLDEATFGDRTGAVLKLVPQTLADKLGLPSVTSLKKEIQERTDLPEGGAIQLIQLPFPKNKNGFDFSEGQPTLKKAQEAAKKRIITTGNKLNIPSHPAYTHFMRGKFLGRFDKVLPKDTLMTDKERARGNAATPKYSDKLVSDPTSQNIVRSNVGGTGALVSPTQEILLDHTNNKIWTESTNKTNRKAFNKHLRLAQRTQILPSIVELNQNELDNSRIFSIGLTDNLEQKTSTGKETVRPAVRVAVVKDTPQALRVKGISTLERDSGSLPTVAGLLKAIDVLGEERQANPEVQLTAKDLIGEDNKLQFKQLGFKKIGVEPLDTSGMVNSEKRALKRILEKQGLDLTTPVKDGSTMSIAGEDFYLPPVNVYQWTGDKTNGTDPSTYYDNFVRNVGLGVRGPLEGSDGSTSRSSSERQERDGQSTQGVRQRPQGGQDPQRSTTDQETRSEVSGTTAEGTDTPADLKFSSGRVPTLTGTRFSSGRRRPLQNNPGGRAKKEFGALKALRQLDHFFDHKSNLPEREAYELLTQKARGEMTNYIEIGHELGDIFLKAKENEQAAIYNYLTERNANASLIPDRQVRGSNKTLRQAAIQAKQDIIQIGEDLVRLGMLDPDAYANRKGKYLPRVYLKYLFSEDHQKILSTGGSLKMSDLGYLKKRKDVDALVRNLVLGEIKSPGYLVSKTLMQSGQDIARMQFLKDLSGNQEWVLPESYVNISYANEIEGILQANPALRQQLLNEGLPPAARQTALRRVTPEYLAAEARRLREQVLPSKKDGSAQKELVRRMIEVLDQKVSQARTNQDYDPENYTQLPDTSRYGDLRGAIVRNEIYDDLVGSQELFTQSGMERGLNYLTSLMKWGLTAANPAVWANNLRSNTAMMHFAGLPFHRSFDYRFRALKQMLTNGSRYQAFKDQGLTLSTFAADELGRMETRLAQSLSADDKKIIGQPLRYSLPVLTAERLGSLIYNAFGDFYQGMEVMDKLALGMYLEDHGPSLGAPLANNRKMTTEAAMREANKALFDYTDVPDWLRRSRRSLLGAPFLTWTYKAAPYLTKMAGDPKKLLRAATWYGGLYTLMAMREVELDDEENDAYYNGLQDWLAKRQLFSIPLPQKDENGMVQTEDYTMFAPHAFLMNAAADILPGGRFSALDVAKDLGFASHPLLESTMELVFNKDSFTGQEIYRSTDTSTQMADKIREHYMDNLLPQFIAPNGWTARMIELSSDNPNVFGPSSVLDRQGNPTRTLGQQAQRVVPFMPNVYPSDLRKGLKYGRQDILRSIQALTKEYSVNRRKYRGDKEALAELKTEYDAERARLQELLREFPTAGQLPRFEEYAE